MPNTNYRNQFFTSAMCMPTPTPMLSPCLPPNDPSLPHGADGVVAPPQQLLQSGLCRVFLCGVHILPIVPVASRDREPGDGDVAGPGGTLASTVGEDLVLWGREVALRTMGYTVTLEADHRTALREREGRRCVKARVRRARCRGQELPLIPRDCIERGNRVCEPCNLSCQVEER